LGLFSCKATEHFEKELKKKDSQVLFLSAPDLIYFKDAFDNSMAAMEGLLQGDCQKVGSYLAPKGSSSASL
jgi:hypothetical protein